MKLNISTKIRALLPFLAFCSLSFSLTHEYHFYERSVIDLRYLYVRGDLQGINISEQPLTYRAVQSNITGAAAKQFPFLSDHFSPTIKFGAGLTNTSGDFQLRSLAQVSLGENLTFVNIMLLDPSIKDEEQYMGKEWRGFVGFAEQGFLDYFHDHGKDSWKTRLSCGRFYDYWGPGRVSQLLISNASRPMDQLRIRFNYGNLSITSKTAKLNTQKETFVDTIDDITVENEMLNQRYLSASRISYEFGHFEIALNQAVVYGGEARNFEFAYLNPFIIFIGEQSNGPFLQANVLGSLDWRLHYNQLSFYGEILIDDVQFDNKKPADLEPNEVGLLTGFDLALSKIYLGIEYTAITNRTYKTPHEFEWFTHRKIPIGYGSGSDLWRINCFSRYYWSPSLQFDLEVDYLVLGEGRMDEDWYAPWLEEDITMQTGYSESFPTGEFLEETLTISAGVYKIFHRNKWVGLNINYIAADNIDNTADLSDSKFEYKLKVFWEFQRGIK